MHVHYRHYDEGNKLKYDVRGEEGIASVKSSPQEQDERYPERQIRNHIKAELQKVHGLFNRTA